MKWFSEREFDCSCCGRNEMKSVFYEKIDRLRDQLGHQLVINSGFRCVDHNHHVGGGMTSRHLVGEAADISMEEMTAEMRYMLLTLALREFRGVGIDRSFLHVDCRDKHRLWVY